MGFVAGNSRDGECGEKRVGRKPPEAVSTFHAKEILCSSFGRVSPSPGETPCGFFMVKHVQTNLGRVVVGGQEAR
jgi:hypothetical protein